MRTDALGDDLFHDVVYALRLNPQQWDQGTWVQETDCGTTMCFAGTTCFIAGRTFKFEERFEERGATHLEVRVADQVKYASGGYNGVVSIAYAAAELLEIDPKTSDILFYTSHYCDTCNVVTEGWCSSATRDKPHRMHLITLEEYIALISRETGLDFSDDFPDRRPNPFLDELGSAK